ncbi:MAG: hypothetical protein WBN14_07655, partial [Polyangiales bacterium]
DFDLAAVQDALARVMPGAKMLKVSAKTGEGIDAWLHWLEERRPAAVERPKEAHTHHDHEHPHEPQHEHH